MFWTYVAADRSDASHVYREIERVLEETVTQLGEREVERARAMAKAAMLMSLESCWGQASYLATRLIRDRALSEPSEIVARLDAVTLNEVREVGAQMLGGQRAIAAVGAKLALAA